MKNNCYVFGRLFKIQENGIFLFFSDKLKLGTRRVRHKRSDTHSVIAMETLLAPVYFYQKTNILIFNPGKLGTELLTILS